MWYYSKISHCARDKIDSWTCGKSCQSYPLSDVKSVYNSKLNIQGFVGYSKNSNSIMIAFRGTEDIKNWVADIELVKKSYEYCSKCEIHLGFHNSYHEIQKPMLDHIAVLLKSHPTSKISVTGHSL